MMEIVCDKCGKQYRIDEGKITKKAARISCKACDNTMLVVKPQADPNGLASLGENDAIPSDLLSTVDPERTPATNSSPGVPEEETMAPPEEIPELAGFERVSFINSIQTRISAGLILITTIILLAYAGITYWTTNTEMEAELANFSEITATRLSKHLVEPFWSLDDEILWDSLVSEMMNEKIHAIIIRDRDGKTAYKGITRNSAWKAVEKARAPDAVTVKSAKPIVKSYIRNNVPVDDKLGVVEVYITRKFMMEDITRFGITIAITMAILIICIFLFTLVILRRIIIRPLGELTDAAERMSMGDLNVRIAIRSRNEIGLLAQAVERMQTSLRFAMEKLGL